MKWPWRKWVKNQLKPNHNKTQQSKIHTQISREFRCGHNNVISTEVRCNSGYGLLSDGPKSSPEPMMTYCTNNLLKYSHSIFSAGMFFMLIMRMSDNYIDNDSYFFQAQRVKTCFSKISDLHFYRREFTGVCKGAIWKVFWKCVRLITSCT